MNNLDYLTAPPLFYKKSSPHHYDALQKMFEPNLIHFSPYHALIFLSCERYPLRDKGSEARHRRPRLTGSSQQRTVSGSTYQDRLTSRTRRDHALCACCAECWHTSRCSPKCHEQRSCSRVARAKKPQPGPASRWVALCDACSYTPTAVRQKTH